MKANGVILNYEVHKLNSTTTLVAWAFTLQCALAYILSMSYFITFVAGGRQWRRFVLGIRTLSFMNMSL